MVAGGSASVGLGEVARDTRPSRSRVDRQAELYLVKEVRSCDEAEKMLGVEVLMPEPRRGGGV